MIEVAGKYGIYAKVLKHSISPQGINLLTFEVSYPRIVLAELNTHGMICKNSSSSRAIPFEKMAQSLTGRPVRFGANQAGMQDKGEEYDAQVNILDYEHDGGPTDGTMMAVFYTTPPDEAWRIAQERALELSEAFYKAGYHKQVYNRLTEPFQMMKTVLTATEYANFFWLRDHDAADPSLRELARCMHEAAKMSKPMLLLPGEWHLPYLMSHRRIQDDVLEYSIFSEEEGCQLVIPLEDAIKVSTARCGAVSFRNIDYGVEKSRSVCDKLVGDLRKHGSAFQHQGTPMQALQCETEDSSCVNDPWYPRSWEEGITHADRYKQLWSAQFRGWIMHRKLIPGENVPGFLLDNSHI